VRRLVNFKKQGRSQKLKLTYAGNKLNDLQISSCKFRGPENECLAPSVNCERTDLHSRISLVPSVVSLGKINPRVLVSFES
jgi:hypothetical protein